jgi:hypothetical protein
MLVATRRETVALVCCGWSLRAVQHVFGDEGVTRLIEQRTRDQAQTYAARLAGKRSL